MKKTPITIKGFTTRIHDVCGKDELRAWMDNVYFHNGKAYATNSYLAVRIPLDRFNFVPEDIEELNGNHITARQFALLLGQPVEKGNLCFKVKELNASIFLTPSDNQQHIERHIKALDEYFDAPFLADYSRKPLLSIGFLPAYAMTIAKALGATGACVFYFTDSDKPIIIEAQDHSKTGLGLIMPVKLTT